MTLRLMEVVVPESGADKVEEILKNQQIDILPSIPMTDDQLLIRFVLEAEEAEIITEKFREAFGNHDNFRINLTALEATIPAHKSREDVEKEKRKSSRISKDELYSDLNDAVEINNTYFALIVLSVVIAAAGLLQNNTAVIIGAMVVAPLLAPNVTLSLSTTLADRKLAGKAFLSLGLGMLLALTLSIILGIILQVDPTLPEISLRTSVGIGDVIVGLAAGAAAALFFSLGIGTALVGVTVAAALLPPLVVTGLLLGAGEFGLATQSLLLLVSNLIGINLAGTAIFIWEGVWPSTWREEKKAKRTALSALVIWVALFLVLVFILLAVQHVIVFS